MFNTPTEEALLVDALTPTAAVLGGRWVDTTGNQIAVAGARGHGVAFSDFSTNDVAASLKVPPLKLTVILLGFAEVELGGVVGDKSFATTDNVGRTVALAAANDEILCFVPKGNTGGAAGDRVRALVLKNVDTRQPAAAVADLVNANGASDGTIADVGAAFNQATLNNNFRDLSDKLNAMLAAQRLQKIIS